MKKMSEIFLLEKQKILREREREREEMREGDE